MDLYNLIISAKLSKGEGGDVSVDPLSVTENGTYTASSGHAYSPVTVSVPTGVFPSGTSQITSNGMYDVTNFASASVNVPGIVPSGTSSITSNGIYDITNFASVDVNVSGGGGGDHDAEDAIIGGYISNYSNSTALTLGTYALYGRSMLETAVFNKVTTVGTYAFGNCSKLHTVRFDNAKTFASLAFRGCSSLASFYLLASSVAQWGAGMFSSTSFMQTGTVYVPASLVSDYRVAYGWSGCSIVAYEG